MRIGGGTFRATPAVGVTKFVAYIIRDSFLPEDRNRRPTLIMLSDMHHLVDENHVEIGRVRSEPIRVETDFSAHCFSQVSRLERPLEDNVEFVTQLGLIICENRDDFR